MQIVCLLTGGPERIILDGKGRKWRFEDHHYCGPVVLTGKTGEVSENQPPENSPFWDAVNLWYAQGKRTRDPNTGEIWCVWDRPKMQKMRHLGGKHYKLVTDEEAFNAGSNGPSGVAAKVRVD
jgi:hypothetical protein